MELSLLLRKAALSLLVLCCFNNCPYAQDQKANTDSIIVMGDVTFWPFEFINGNKQADGIFVDLWKRIGELSGVKVIYKCDNWDAAQNLVYEGKADALGSADITPKRLEKLKYIGVLHTLYIYVYYRNTLTGFKDLSSIGKEFKVGLVKGDISVYYVSEHFPNVSIQEFDNYEDLVDAALSDSLFIFAMEPPAANYYFIHHNKLQSTFKQSNSYLMKETLYCAIRKDKVDLINKITLGLGKLNNSEKEKIFKKWNYIQESSFWEEFKAIMDNYPWLKYVFMFLGIYLFLVLIWVAFYFLNPAYLIEINSAVKKGADFKISFKGFSLQLPFSKIFLLDYFTFSEKVADSWMMNKRKLIEKNIEEINTFKERIIYASTPLKIDSKIFNNSNAIQLELEIKEEIKSKFKTEKIIYICGEGGGGKTALSINIARWVVSANSFLGFFCIPIFIETDIDSVAFSKDETGPSFFIAIKNICEKLLKEERRKKTDISADWLKYLINKCRILLIVDGLSELSENTKSLLINHFNDYGINATVITSRVKDERAVKDFPKIYVSPLRLNGIHLSIFIENILSIKKLRDKFSDIEFYMACKYLAGISGTRDVTILFAVLFIDVLINQKIDNNEPFGVKSIAELVKVYIENINNKITENPFKNEDVIILLKRIAWIVLKPDLLPLAIKKSTVTAELKAIEQADEKMNYIIRKLNIINEFDALIPKYKFSLDPVSEYLAALFIIDNMSNSIFTQIEYIEKYLQIKGVNPEDIVKSNEFLQAFCDCCLSLDVADLKVIRMNSFSNTLICYYLETYKKNL